MFNLKNLAVKYFLTNSVRSFLLYIEVIKN